MYSVSIISICRNVVSVCIYCTNTPRTFRVQRVVARWRLYSILGAGAAAGAAAVPSLAVVPSSRASMRSTCRRLLSASMSSSDSFGIVSETLT